MHFPSAPIRFRHIDLEEEKNVEAAIEGAVKEIAGEVEAPKRSKCLLFGIVGHSSKKSGHYNSKFQ